MLVVVSDVFQHGESDYDYIKSQFTTVLSLPLSLSCALSRRNDKKYIYIVQVSIIMIKYNNYDTNDNEYSFALFLFF